MLASLKQSESCGINAQQVEAKEMMHRKTDRLTLNRTNGQTILYYFFLFN
jgi:hypothetical protein